MVPQLFLLLPALASCSITVSVQTFDDLTHPWIQLQGNYTEIITEEEAVTFRLDDKTLKEAAKAYSGEKPKWVFLEGSNSWANLHQEHNWPEVRRILLPIKSEILGIQTEEFAVTEMKFDGDTTSKIDYNGVNGIIQDSFEVKWITDDNFHIDEEDMTYSVGGSADISFTSPWGNETVKHVDVLFGVDPVWSTDSDLKPGQEVAVTLSTTKVTLAILIEYIAKLDGEVACTYDPKFKNQQYWNYEVNAMLKAGGYPTKLKAVQILKIQYHINGKITVTDEASKEPPKIINAVLTNIDDGPEILKDFDQEFGPGWGNRKKL